MFEWERLFGVVLLIVISLFFVLCTVFVNRLYAMLVCSFQAGGSDISVVHQRLFFQWKHARERFVK